MQDQSQTNAIDTNSAIAAPATAEAVTTEATVADNTIAQPTTWLNELSEEFRGAKPLQNFADKNDLAKSYLHLNKLLGDKVQNWAKEDVEGLLGKLGRPETADNYEMPTELGEAAVKELKDMAYKAGLSKEQAKAFADEVALRGRTQKEQADAQSGAQAKEWVDSIKAEFGSAFDERIALAKRATTELGGQEFVNLLNETGLGNHPVMVKMMAKIGKEFLEEGRIVKGDHKAVFGVTPAEAQNEINVLRHNKEFMDAYGNLNHPRHKEMVSKWEKLHSQAYI